MLFLLLNLQRFLARVSNPQTQAAQTFDLGVQYQRRAGYYGDSVCAGVAVSAWAVFARRAVYFSLKEEKEERGGGVHA